MGDPGNAKELCRWWGLGVGMTRGLTDRSSNVTLQLAVWQGQLLKHVGGGSDGTLV